MKRLHLPTGFAIAALASLVACASLAGLDDSDAPAGSSGGPASGSSGTGQITQDGITIAPKDLTLPAFKCNESATGAITLTNDSDEDQPFEATLSANDVFRIASGDKGTVAKHDTATIMLEAKSAKPATATAVQVAIKTKSAVATVSAKVDVQGAILKITPEKADFGFVRQDQPSAPINAIFTNEGNVPVTISGFDGPPELSSFTLPATVVVDGNKTTEKPISMTAAKAGAPIRATATPKIEDLAVLCGAPAPVLTLLGQRVSDDVIVSPASADFGSADCNATSSSSSTATIKVSNFSLTKGADITVTPAANTHFKVSPTTASLSAASGPSSPSTQDITISVNNAGDTPGKVTESLDVSVSVSGTPRSFPIALTMGVAGAVYVFNPATLDNIPNAGSKSTSLQNTGNASACVKVESSNNAFNGPDYGLFPPLGSSFKVSFNANVGSGHVTGTMTLKPTDVCIGASGVICKPAVLPVSGDAP